MRDGRPIHNQEPFNLKAFCESLPNKVITLRASVYPSTPGRGPVGDFGPFLSQPVSALGFEEFLPKTVEWKASLNRLVRRELVS